jgi:hypothetical protein
LSELFFDVDNLGFNSFSHGVFLRIFI